ncbi:MAG TPA: flagellar assembly protein FliW [Spirochaetales bacterium]|nr:flagellar assembly protein FliW [Spirochaetales bacterium]
MKIASKSLGEINVDERQIITFQEGLIGFTPFTRFALLDAPQKPYFYLQSMESQELAFILVDPFLFRPDYSLDLSEELCSALGIAAPEETLILTLVTAPTDGSPVTANLMGPLVISKATRKGVQLILADPRWKTKHDVMAELAASRK